MPVPRSSRLSRGGVACALAAALLLSATPAAASEGEDPASFRLSVVVPNGGVATAPSPTPGAIRPPLGEAGDGELAVTGGTPAWAWPVLLGGALVALGVAFAAPARRA